MSTVLSERDVPDLLNILDDAKAVWDILMTQVGLCNGEIEAIRRDEGDSLRCLKKSILLWLHQVDPPPTKERLVAALMSPSVKREDLAVKVLPNYVQSCGRMELEPPRKIHEIFKELKQMGEKNASSLQYLLECIRNMESRMENLQDSMEQSVELLDKRWKHAMEQYNNKIDDLEERTMHINSTRSNLSQKQDDIQLEAASVCSTMSSAYGSGESIETFQFSPGMSRRIDIAPHGYAIVTTSSLGPNTATITPQHIESLTTRLMKLEHSVNRYLSSSLDQELRIQLLEKATYNGILLWKMDEFERRRKEATEGVTLSLYSTPFYTARHGYKMCARICLNGDGLGKGTHMSFFIVIMRGPIDELLPWPFKQKVTLTLLNQDGYSHVTDSFHPDPHSSSFQWPGRREMNIASGCPMFIRQEHLANGGFVKDDCIYVRVVVDTTDLPT